MDVQAAYWLRTAAKRVQRQRLRARAPALEFTDEQADAVKVGDSVDFLATLEWERGFYFLPVSVRVAAVNGGSGVRALQRRYGQLRYVG